MKIICFVILVFFINSNEIFAQYNYLVIKYGSTKCGELTQMDNYYCSRATYDKYVHGEYVTNPISLINDSLDANFFKELEELNNQVFKDLKIKNLKLLDTLLSNFYMEFAIGYNEKRKNYFKIYGVINCIRFIDRIIVGLEEINPSSQFINIFDSEQEILLYDRLCKCND